MHFEIKSIGIWSFLKVAFFVNAILGLMAGLLYVPFIIVISNGLFYELGMTELIDSDFRGGGILFLMFFIPAVSTVLGAVFYTMFELVIVIVYNLISKFFGGVELELESPKGTSLNISASREQEKMFSHKTSVVPPPSPPPPPPPVTESQPLVMPEQEEKRVDGNRDNQDENSI